MSELDNSAGPNSRSAAKAQRRQAILDSAKALFAAQGFRAVSIEDIGAGAGVSGPAVYRHFASKEEILEELLLGISAYLHAGGGAILAAGLGPEETLRTLVDFHLDFALGEPELIRIQDRDLASLPAEARRQVRRLQRSYVTGWAGALRAHDPGLSADAATVSVHALFGMVNSTPYVVRRIPGEVVAAQLRNAALAALGVRGSKQGGGDRLPGSGATRLAGRRAGRASVAVDEQA
ncbi:TetR/AcrR family transcriptional regulator [Brevibacterium daeguense]|uniref:TetR/AcrR family transcriptional regulator n=1 Tax=Brevibacterium daeguense TaxID=909936 RepID=A0ABP8ELI0_9MICO|nr:TetR/AcrR family transcriptional regulator [Brevibacterium daeguense]